MTNGSGEDVVRLLGAILQHCVDLHRFARVACRMLDAEVCRSLQDKSENDDENEWVVRLLQRIMAGPSYQW